MSQTTLIQSEENGSLQCSKIIDMSEDASADGGIPSVDEASPASSPPTPPPSTLLEIAPEESSPSSDHSSPPSPPPPSIEIPAPQRPRLDPIQLDSMSAAELVLNWRDLESYVDWMDMQAANHEAEIATLRAYVERAKQQQIEACSREKAVLRRLATKEQEIQEYIAQIGELKSSTTPNTPSLRSALLDPAVNLLIQKLRTELTQTRSQLEETQNELSAWKFTPDSNTGKRLMAKCRLLYQENEELGRLVSSGRMAKLEGELALQKSFSQEVKKSQSELDEFLQELDEDVEGMQSTIYYLQQELRKSRDSISNLELELRKLRKPSHGASKSKHRTLTEDGEEDGGLDGEEDGEDDGGREDDGAEDMTEDNGEDDMGEDEENMKDWMEEEGEYHRHSIHSSDIMISLNNGDDSHSVCSKRTNLSDDSEESNEIPLHKKVRTNDSGDDMNHTRSARVTNGTHQDNDCH